MLVVLSKDTEERDDMVDETDDGDRLTTLIVPSENRTGQTLSNSASSSKVVGVEKECVMYNRVFVMCLMFM